VVELSHAKAAVRVDHLTRVSFSYALKEGRWHASIILGLALDVQQIQNFRAAAGSFQTCEGLLAVMHSSATRSRPMMEQGNADFMLYIEDTRAQEDAFLMRHGQFRSAAACHYGSRQFQCTSLSA